MYVLLSHDQTIFILIMRNLSIKSLKSLGWAFNHSRLLVSITANQQNSSALGYLAEVFFGRFEAMFVIRWSWSWSWSSSTLAVVVLQGVPVLACHGFLLVSAT